MPRRELAGRVCGACSGGKDASSPVIEGGTVGLRIAVSNVRAVAAGLQLVLRLAWALPYDVVLGFTRLERALRVVVREEGGGRSAFVNLADPSGSPLDFPDPNFRRPPASPSRVTASGHYNAPLEIAGIDPSAPRRLYLHAGLLSRNSNVVILEPSPSAHAEDTP